MLYAKVYKTYEGVRKAVAFERALVRDGSRGNVNYRFYAVRCRDDGTPDGESFEAGRKYVYRIEKTLRDHPTDPRLLGR